MNRLVRGAGFEATMLASVSLPVAEGAGAVSALIELAESGGYSAVPGPASLLFALHDPNVTSVPDAAPIAVYRHK